MRPTVGRRAIWLDYLLASHRLCQVEFWNLVEVNAVGECPDFETVTLLSTSSLVNIYRA